MNCDFVNQYNFITQPQVDQSNNPASNQSDSQANLVLSALLSLSSRFLGTVTEATMANKFLCCLESRVLHSQSATPCLW